MKRICIIIIIILSISIYQIEAVSLLNNPLHSRAAGMGNAFSALADDSSALFYNPALLYDIEDHMVTIGYSHLFLNANDYSFSYVHPKIHMKPDVGVSVACMMLKDDQIRRYSSVDLGDPGSYDRGEDFDFSEYVVMLGSGAKIMNQWMIQFSGGFNFKYYYSSLDTYKGKGVGFDLGLNAKHRLFNTALVFKNLLCNLNGENESTGVEAQESLPLIIRTGFLFRLKRILNDIFESQDERPSSRRPGLFINWIVNPVVDFEFVMDDEFYVNVFTGLEMWVNNVFGIRTGYNTVQGLSCGISAKVEIVQFDYSYSIHSELQGTHRIAGTYYF